MILPVRGFLRTLLSVAGAAGIAAAPAFADETGISPSAATTLGVPNGPNPDTGMAVGRFLVYPQFFIGAVYNDNILASATARKSGWGLQFAPSLNAVDDEGIHKTTLNFSGNAQFYPGVSADAGSGGQTSQVSGNVKLDHVWTPAPDVSVDVWSGVTRQNSVFGSTGSGAGSFVNGATSVNVGGYQQYSDSITGGLSVEKKFSDQFFVRVGVGGQDLIYENAPPGFVSSQSGVEGNGFARAGYYILPTVNAFVETGVDAWRYRNSWYDTNAYRVIGGLSSDLIGLFRGEVFAGYQQQSSAHGVFGSVNAPTYGGKLSYYPTRYLTFAASLNQSFGSAAAQNPNQPYVGSPSTQTLQSRFEADYTMAEYWSVTAQAGWAQTTWSNSPVVETAWTIGGGVSYSFWRNVGLGANYQYQRTLSNSALAPGYAQSIVSAGLTYHY